MAELTGGGHPFAYAYRVVFFMEAYKAMAQKRIEDIRDLSKGVRAAKLKDDAYKKFMTDKEEAAEKPKEKKVLSADQHLSIIKRLRGVT